jgi:drug/metabolite transporter (DMT)-like permease
MRVNRGPLLLIMACVLFTAEVCCLRLLGDRVSQGQIILFRAGAQIVLAVGWIAATGGTRLLRTRRLGSHLVRGLLSVVGWWLYYKSFRSLDLALATTLSFTSQIFVLVLAWPVLGEKVTGHRLGATLVGFAGIAIALNIWTAQVPPAAVYGLAGALVGAVLLLVTRALAATEQTATIMVYLASVVFLAAIPQAAFDWRPLRPDDLALLGVLAVLGTVGNALLVEAYRHAEASALAPYPYSRLLFSAVAGWFVFGEVATLSTLAGAVLIVGSIIYLLVAESRSRVDEAPQSSA